MSVYVDDQYRVLSEKISEINSGDLATVFSGEIDCYVGFAVSLDQVLSHSMVVEKMIKPDPIVWIAYPKQTSKKFRCEFNRDTGWESLGLLGFEPVRQVAIDEDWSALRFRRVGNIKTMTRSFSMTDEGRRKSKSNAL
jgi:hypothetical protein